MGAENMKETVEILRRLSPDNQTYFMTLVRVAEVAEKGIKSNVTRQPQKRCKTDGHDT